MDLCSKIYLLMRKVLIALGIFVLILIITIPVIFYFINRSEPAQVASGPNPTQEHQKFLYDTTITKIYFGILPCSDCAGIETAVSLSQVEGNETSGTFIITKTYLESERQTEEYSGTWRFSDTEDENSKSLIILRLDNGTEEIYELIDPETLILLDENGSQAQDGENYTLKLL